MPRRRRPSSGARAAASSAARIDWLVVGLGNPGSRYAGTRHNVGFEVVSELTARWDLPKAKGKYAGLLTEGRAGVGGPRVAVLLPQTYMNDAGRSVGPARGAYRIELDRLLVVHDEIDLPFGAVRTRLGGGLAGHNGLKSIAREVGGRDFARVRVGVGRPESTDPDVVAGYVLARFGEPGSEVRELVARGGDAVERIVVGEALPGEPA